MNKFEFAKQNSRSEFWYQDAQMSSPPSIFWKTRNESNCKENEKEVFTKNLSYIVVFYVQNLF